MTRRAKDQPALFPMLDDARPGKERSAAERYREPSLLDAIREAPAIDYDALIRQAAEHVLGVRLDICRHPNTPLTYWLFDGEAQIGSVANDRAGWQPWRACRMARGMPTAQQHFVQLPDALRWAAGIGGTR